MDKLFSSVALITFGYYMTLNLIEIKKIRLILSKLENETNLLSKK